MRGSPRITVLLIASLILIVTGLVFIPFDISATTASIANTPELPPATLPAVASPPIAADETRDATVSLSSSAALAGAPISPGFRISIPRLKIDLPIAEGDLKRDIDDRRTPDGFAFHFPGTALPGQHGNIYLYAHARQGMFLALWNARPGDEVVISSPEGQLWIYVVREVYPRVSPADVSPTEPTTSERLTLQTSTGPNASDPRFVVFAFPRGG